MGSVLTTDDADADVTTFIRVVSHNMDADAAMQMLRSQCEDSGAMYGIIWEYSCGRLCVIATWAGSGDARRFTVESSKVMLGSGEGLVGRVFRDQSFELVTNVCALTADSFIRIDFAKTFGVHSVYATPWGTQHVLEFGASKAWTDPPSLMTGMRPLTSSLGIAIAWQAALWKQSTHFGFWRQRLMRLTKVLSGPCDHVYQLSSSDPATGRLTGLWQLKANLPTIKIRPRYGFQAWTELDGVTLAADTAVGSEALEELAAILDGTFKPLAAINNRIAHSNVQWSRAADSDTENRSRAPSCELRFGHPSCENCGDPSKGRLVANPFSKDEIGKWLCQTGPESMCLGKDGQLHNATPPKMKRCLSAPSLTRSFG